MDKYSVGRGELLGWINDTLCLNLSKIEQTSTGAVACQLLDALSPGSINIAKVDFNAKDEYTSINNYKILQAGFLKEQIEKPIDVNKLIKARPLDNMEFMQWFKAYFEEHNGSVADYDPVHRRSMSKTGDMKGLKKMANGKKNVMPLSNASLSNASNGNTTPRSGIKAQRPKEFKDFPLKGKGNDISDAEMQQRIDIEALKEEGTEMRVKIDTLERERDFYFDKLREIEILCQNKDVASTPIIKFIERILYATDEREAKEAMLEAQSLYAGAEA